MAWTLTTDLEQFIATAGRFLRSEPVRHTVFLTLIEGLRSQGPHVYGPQAPHFGWWSPPADEVCGALIHTPPFPVMFTELPAEAVPAAVGALAGHPLSGANLLAGDVAAFTAGWQERTGVKASAGMRTRLFRLDRLISPDPAPTGGARPATEADRALLIDWLDTYHEYIGEQPPDLEAMVDARLESGGVTLWEDGGVPVALAIRSRPEAGMVRIQTVYTPAEHRRRGYGAGVTTAATQAALDAGATDVVLFTDLANPTSNALYPRLGYRPIEDRAVVKFPS
ncbi:GNAT family N-acetyltransferase [Actinoplanes sp. NBC_00393]|uniref:GNAT family N-acetyltransferase n=1 Tax=Actinoplanes sp. NBC_00393 TaxID=2975953 RepID=UPI002E1B855A